MEKTVENLQAQINDLARRLAERQIVEQVDAAVKYTQLPDTLKYLPEFTGDKNTLTTWIDTVERTLILCQESEGSAVYQMWLGHVRNRVVGKANKALLTKNCPLNWTTMKQILNKHFSSKRILSNIVSDILVLKQNSLSLKNYISVCEELYYELNTNIYQDQINAGHECAIMRVMTITITNAFIDGLNYDLPRLIRTSKPESLEDAFKAARELTEVHVREKQRNQSTDKPSVRTNHSAHYNRSDTNEAMDVDPSTRQSNNSRSNRRSNEIQGNRQTSYFKPTGQPRFHVEELTNVHQNESDEVNDDLNFHMAQQQKDQT